MTELEDNDDFPSTSPAGEADAPHDSAFVAQCLSQLNVLSAKGPITPNGQRLTRNDRFGLVFRVDFTMGDRPDDGLVNRLICWKTDDGSIATMFAIGQDVPPLTAR
jgi:hypothetical protein